MYDNSVEYNNFNDIYSKSYYNTMEEVENHIGTDISFNRYFITFMALFGIFTLSFSKYFFDIYWILGFIVTVTSIALFLRRDFRTTDLLLYKQ